MTQPTNAELDRFLAEEVMGWSICGEGKNACYCKGAGHNYAHVSFNDWHPSADIARAIGCVKKWCNDNAGAMTADWDANRNTWIINLWREDWDAAEIENEEYAFAICLALYEAMKCGE